MKQILSIQNRYTFLLQRYIHKNCIRATNFLPYSNIIRNNYDLETLQEYITVSVKIISRESKLSNESQIVTSDSVTEINDTCTNGKVAIFPNTIIS